MKISHRFRGFLPVVVDVETGGFDPIRDALLEVAFVFIDYDEFLADSFYNLGGFER